MADGLQCSWGQLWGFFKTRSDNDPNNSLAIQMDIYKQIRSFMPSMSVSEMVDMTHDAPDGAQGDLWGKWAEDCDTRGYSLIGFRKATSDLPPGILAIAWSAWMRQNDLRDYPADQVKKVARALPISVVKKLSVMNQPEPKQIGPGEAAVTGSLRHLR